MAPSKPHPIPIKLSEFFAREDGITQLSISTSLDPYPPGPGIDDIEVSMMVSCTTGDGYTYKEPVLPPIKKGQRFLLVDVEPYEGQTNRGLYKATEKLDPNKLKKVFLALHPKLDHYDSVKAFGPWLVEKGYAKEVKFTEWDWVDD